MKRIFIALLAFSGLFTQAKEFETSYDMFDGGLRIEKPFQMECEIQQKHYIIIVNFGEFHIKVLENGKWVRPFHVRFGPDGMAITFVTEFAKNGTHAIKGYGFALGNINFNHPDPIRGVYRDFDAGKSWENPYIEIPHACDFIDQ